MTGNDLTNRGFSPWCQFIPATWAGVLKSVPEKCGIYAIREKELFARYNGESDVVYIGCTESKKGLRNRIRQHISGNKTQKTCYRVHRWAKERNCLEIAWMVVSASQSRSEEQALLSDYISDHWELPPLNRSE